MTDADGTGRLREQLRALIDSALFARAFTLAVMGTAFGSFAIHATAGTVTYTTVLLGLVLLGAALLWVRRGEFEGLRIVPWLLILFFAWLFLSTFWAFDTPGALGGWFSAAAVAFLGFVVTFARDTLQTARALGDVLRTLLIASLGLEILSGILLDLPITFLHIQGNIATGGGIQGLFGTRNMLGFVCVLALITFVIEWRTASVQRGLAVFSISLAALLMLLSASPTAFMLAAVLLVATAALAWTRHTKPSRRPVLQTFFVAAVLLGGVLIWTLWGRIVSALGARQDLTMREELWSAVLESVRLRLAHGWGFTGSWPSNEMPYLAINFFAGERHSSALNAYLDVLLQAGLVGLALFLAAALIALGRSWVVAAARRSTVYAWTPLVLVAILVESILESYALEGAGLLLLTVCITRARTTQSPRRRDAQDSQQPAR